MISQPSFEVGEMVRIRSGPFQAFTGRIEEVDNSKSTLRVLVLIFGRYEPIELGFADVEKLGFTQEDN
jgi:transcription termination/antitermination protein NusG